MMIGLRAELKKNRTKQNQNKAKMLSDMEETVKETIL